MPNRFSKLCILVSNDDGIHAGGLALLERVAGKISKDVWVVAPEMEQSGASHSLTMHIPLRIRKITARKFAVSGTPTDCVLLGVRAIMPRKKKVHLVLSGVNRGSNVAEDVTYSGTIAAAMEGTLLGIPSIAISLAVNEKGESAWTAAEHILPELICKLLEAKWHKNTLVNINIPDLPLSRIKGVRLCPQGARAIGEKLECRVDPKGRPYYWIGGPDRKQRGEKPGVDVDAIQDGYIAVTPLSLDLTDYEQLETMRSAIER
jgi:5'-nucleotidase